MKNLWTAACVAALVAMGCGPAIKLDERPLFQYGVNTVTFLVFDAFTGAPIKDATVTVNVGTYALTAVNPTGTNAFVVSQLPAGTLLATIDAPGHLGFVGQPQPNCNSSPVTGGPLTNPSSQCYLSYQVPLFPSTGVTDDVKVRVFESDKGATVTTGTVVATLTAQGTVGTTFNNVLPGGLSTRPNTVIAQLDGTGTATLPKDQLVLGGVYSVDVFGAKGTGGVYLAPSPNNSFTAGQTFGQLTVFMGPPAITPVATSANNEAGSGSNTVHGTLVVNFPYPVELCNNPGVDPYWWLSTGSDVNANGILAAPLPNASVAVAIAADTSGGSSVTLTPKFNTPTGAIDPADGLQIASFDNVSIRVKGSSECDSLFSVRLRGPFPNPLVSRSIMIAAAP